MAGTATVRTYIDQYPGSEGRTGGELREMHTGLKGASGFFKSDDPEQIMAFITAGYVHAAAMPDLLDKDGDEDAAEVARNVDFDSPEALWFCDVATQYLFV